MNAALLLASFSVAGTISYIAIFVALHVMPTGYNPIRHAVSDYAIGDYGRWFTAGLWCSSIGVLSLALGLRDAVGSPPLAAKDLWFLGLIAVCRVGMSVFDTNLEGHRFTRSAAMHYVLAILAFTFSYLSITDLSEPLKAIRPWSTAATLLTWPAWLVGPALGGVVVAMIPILRRVFGLFERLFLITTNVWLLAVGILLVVKTS
jgi:hypothetical protein